MTTFTIAGLTILGALAATLMSRTSKLSADAAKAAIGLISGGILFWHIFTTDDHNWVATVFAFSALGLFLESTRRLLQQDSDQGG